MNKIIGLYKIKDELNNLPIRRKLMLAFLMLIIFPSILIGILSFYRSSKALTLKTRQYTNDILMETANNIEVKLREAERLSFQVVSNSEVQTALKNANRGFIEEYERISTEKIIDSQLNGLISSDADIAAIQIISNSGVTYYINPGSVALRFREEDKKVIEQAEGSACWFDTNSENQTITLGRAVNSISNLQRIGYVFIYLRESSIFNIYKKTELFKNGEILIINKEGTIISYKDKNMLSKKSELSTNDFLNKNLNQDFITSKVNGKNFYATYRAIAGNNWRILTYIPAVEYERDIVSLRKWIVLICGSCCFLALIISIAISDSISKPLRNLSKMMLKVGEGDFNAFSPYESQNEIGILSRHFNKMVAQVQQLIQEVYQEQLLKQKAELKSLRMQINPHFLYNTLESINWIARIKGIPEIGKMVKALGDLMRSSISGDDFVSVEEEIKNISNYLTIQKFRYGDRFEVEVDVSENILAVKIPKLILQPIVENAIVHGLENKVGTGRIEIIGFIEDSKICLVVNDNGIGMDQNTIDLLLSNKPMQETEGHTHIGLRNVDNRLKMYYGKEYGIEINSEVGNGTSVTIYIPEDLNSIDEKS